MTKQNNMYLIPYIFSIILILVYLNKKEKDSEDLVTLEDTDYHLLASVNQFRNSENILKNLHSFFLFHRYIKHYNQEIDKSTGKPSNGFYYPYARVIIWCTDENSIKLKAKYDSYKQKYQDGTQTNIPAFTSVEILPWKNNSIKDKIKKIFKNKDIDIAHTRYGSGIGPDYLDNEIIFFIKSDIKTFVKNEGIIDNIIYKDKNVFLPVGQNMKTPKRDLVIRNTKLEMFKSKGY